MRVFAPIRYVSCSVCQFDSLHAGRSASQIQEPYFTATHLGNFQPVDSLLSTHPRIASWVARCILFRCMLQSSHHIGVPLIGACISVCSIVKCSRSTFILPQGIGYSLSSQRPSLINPVAVSIHLPSSLSLVNSRGYDWSNLIGNLILLASHCMLLTNRYYSIAVLISFGSARPSIHSKMCNKCCPLDWISVPYSCHLCEAFSEVLSGTQSIPFRQ